MFQKVRAGKAFFNSMGFACGQRLLVCIERVQLLLNFVDECLQSIGFECLIELINGAVHIFYGTAAKQSMIFLCDRIQRTEFVGIGGRIHKEAGDRYGFIPLLKVVLF